MITWLLGTVSAWNIVYFFFEKDDKSLTWWNYFKRTNTQTDSTHQKQPRPHRFPCWISQKFVFNGINIGFMISFKNCMYNADVNKVKGTQETTVTACQWKGKSCHSPGDTWHALRFWGTWHGSRGGTELSAPSCLSKVDCAVFSHSSRTGNQWCQKPKAQTGGFFIIINKAQNPKVLFWLQNRWLQPCQHSRCLQCQNLLCWDICSHI